MLGRPVGRGATLNVVAAVGASSDRAISVTSWSGSLKVEAVVRLVSTGARAKELSLRMNERLGSTKIELDEGEGGAELGTSASIEDEGPLGKTMELLGVTEGVIDGSWLGGGCDGPTELGVTEGS